MTQRSTRQREYADMGRDFQRRQREFQEDLNARRNEELQQVMERANKAVKQVAEQRNLTWCCRKRCMRECQVTSPTRSLKISQFGHQ